MASTDLERMKKRLFRIAMKGDWNEVLNIYKDNPLAHRAKITRSGGTALHIAVSDCQEDIVEELVRLICKEEDPKEALKIENERGNTPLHLAASMGNARMCHCIAKEDPELVGVRNRDCETPFFLAALYGKKEAFLCLHDIIGNTQKGYSYCRREGGDTILHLAISGDYFDLAYQIIFLYRDLVNSVNEQGISPLHLLASKPSAFRSGSHLSRWNKIVYHCIFVDELKAEPCHHQTFVKTFDDKKNPKYLENYQTCIHFFRLLRNMILAVTTKRRQANVENPEPGHQGYQSTNGPQGHQLFPSNYDTCFQSIKFVSKAMLVILGLGFTATRKLQDKKQKHTWSVQILNELLQGTSMCEYEDDGGNPKQSPRSEDNETMPYAFEEGGIITFSEDQQATLTTILPETNQNKGKNDKDKNGEGERKNLDNTNKEILISVIAKNGVTEMVEKVELFRLSFPDLNSDKKNIVSLLVENKQPYVYELLLERNILKDKNREGEEKNPDREKKETPILIAAKNGVAEVVEKILELFPVAIHDMNSDKKNAVLLAVENRQPHVYELLLKRNILKDSVFHEVDNQGNSALHLAAMLGQHRPWLIPGAALQMQWEIKWYKFVKNSMSLHFFAHYNKEGKTPKDVFTDTHKDLVKMGGEWLTSTSNSCSLVAALIATVAFATSATVPGGIKENIGTPLLEDKPAFNVFAISSLVALCFSVTAVVMFLAILTSRYQEKDFSKDLPRKLLLGLTSLFISIASMLISFCAGHFFVLKDKLRYAAFPVYAVTCLPVTFFAIAQFPLYFDLIRATFKKVPQRSYQVVPL